jgi:soluble lytic murein transglycosylase
MRPVPAVGRQAAWGIVLVLGALAVGAGLGWRVGGPPALDRWDSAIVAAATEAGVDPALLRAMVAVESGGRPRAESDKGARGLLQVVPTTAWEEARRLGLDVPDDAELYRPETNLRIGASYLARLLRRYDGEEAFAVAAYNAGPTAVDRWRKLAPDAAPLDVILREGYAETRKHVVRVLRWKDAYR